MGKPNPTPARLTAYELVNQVNRQGAYANLRLPELLAKSKMTQADKAFTTELAYGSLRMQGQHDYIAAKYLDRPFSEVDEKIQDLLRIGIHQITQMRVASHAAVSETVEVAKLVAGESKASYVNAILRKVSEANNDLAELSDKPVLERLVIQYSHPEWIISAFYDQLQDWQKVEELLQANNLPVKPDVISWPGKSSIAELSGLSWLDMCAGPGGKAAYLFHSLTSSDPTATFLANEPIPHRAELVKRVVNNQQVVSFDATDATNFSQRFDRILVDAPCTGLGALRRRPEARWRRTIKDLKELVLLQRQLLSSAYELLKPGGVIAYVTCSPHLAETKGQVLDFLSTYPDMQLLPMQSLPLAHNRGVLPDGTVQLWTHRDQSDAMFMALLKKVG